MDRGELTVHTCSQTWKYIFFLHNFNLCFDTHIKVVLCSEQLINIAPSPVVSA